MRAALELSLVALLACGCAGAPPRDAHAIVVTDHAGAVAWQGRASFTVRSVHAGKAERVVGLPGLGELQVAMDDSACRLVWSREGLHRLTLFQGARCAERRDGRLCFAGARLRAFGDTAGAPLIVEVNGCADENDLLWGKLPGGPPVSVGPKAYRQRCRELPRRRGCELVYVKREAALVEHNDARDGGFELRFDGDGWRACFLEKASGRYDLRLTIEDSCGSHGSVTLAGDSADLDD